MSTQYKLTKALTNLERVRKKVEDTKSRIDTKKDNLEKAEKSENIELDDYHTLKMDSIESKLEACEMAEEKLDEITLEHIRPLIDNDIRVIENISDAERLNDICDNIRRLRGLFDIIGLEDGKFNEIHREFDTAQERLLRN